MELLRVSQSEIEPSQREKALVKLWERGIEAPDCIAYHGTSLETMQYLIERGFVPGYTGEKYENPDLSQPGDIYFFPRLKTFPFERLPGLLSPDRINSMEGEFALQAVQQDTTIAFSHRFCGYLQLEIERYGFLASFYEDPYFERVQNIEFLNAQKKLRELGVPEKRVRQAVEEAKKRKGVVIGLSRDALDQFPFSEGDAGNDFRLSPGIEGLPHTVLSGIKPIGEEEMAFFQNLKIKHRI